MPLREPRWRHPELQPGWIDRPHQTLAMGVLLLSGCDVAHNAQRDFQEAYHVRYSLQNLQEG